ncbi:MAG TPA: TIM barrel protein [Rhizomicrobium sp.]|nr:TIM barrel protein [Rhizomicrobium sp.]
MREIEIADATQRAGFDFVEGVFRAGRPPAAVAGTTRTLASLDLGRLSLCHPREDLRRAARAAIEALIDFSASCGIGLVSFGSGRGLPSDIDRLCDELHPLFERAQARGVRLCIENVPGHVTQSREAMTEIVAAVEQAAICLDVANTLFDGPLEPWFATFGRRIAKLHLGDATISCEGRFVPALPGEGAVSWESVRAGLAGLPDDVCLVAELLGGTVGAEEQFAAQGGTRLRALLAP